MKAGLFFPTFVELVRKKRSQPTSSLPLRDDQRQVLFICVKQARDGLASIHRFFLNETLNPLRSWYAR